MYEPDWWAIALLASVVVAAALVNWRAKPQIARVRRAVFIAGLFGVALGLREGFDFAESPVWYGRLDSITDVIRSFAFVNVGCLVTFFVLLPAVRVTLPTIAIDLFAALAYILALFATMARHHVDLASMLATGAVASAVLAISLQQTLGNILGGVALQLDGSIKEGDWVLLENGKQGKVRAIRWRHTLIETRDWSTMVVPNSTLLANNFTILGKREGKPTPQRMWVYFNVDFRHSPAHVVQVVSDALLAAPIENVAEFPKPSVVCMDFAKDGRDSFAYYAARYWIVDLATDDPTNSRVRTRVFTALRRAGIPLALPVTTNLVQVQDQAHFDVKKARDLDLHLEALKGVHLFAKFTPDELRTLAAGMKPAIYVKDELITKQGAVAHWLYIIANGECEVQTTVDLDGDGPAPEHKKHVATLGSGAFFGEMGLMTGEPRRANVIAKGDVECLRLGKSTFQRVIKERPEIAVEIANILATRKVELDMIREGLGEEARRARLAKERENILSGIKTFFGL